MKLTTRVSAFFLAALAIGLGIYSLVFYSVARGHIDYQFEQELRSVLQSLVAAVEVEETEAKWQPLEHSFALGSFSEYGAVNWLVVGDQHLSVEQSHFSSEPFRSHAMSLAGKGVNVGETFKEYDPKERLQYYYQRLAAPRPVDLARELDEFDEITIIVGRSTVPRDAVLRRLTLLVILLPLLSWLIAAALGQWIVRHALHPLTSMARQSQSISGSDFQSRLKTDDSGDELSELGTAFNRLLDRQQVAFEQQRRFAGDAAHELRTPLTVLLGQIDVTLRRPRTVAEYASNLQLLRQQTMALQEIVESLLFLARSDEDGVLPRSEPLAISHWLDTYWSSWKNVPRHSDLELDNALRDDCQVFAPASLLARILDNLVSNALKYSESGTPIVVSAADDRGQIVLRVSDSGAGISEADVPSIFDPFFRSANARNAGIAGNGLGLAIASRIAKSLNGSLECDSTLGQESSFTLRLPQS